MDDCPPDHCAHDGAPVCRKGSHHNPTVSSNAVFVGVEKDGLLEYLEMLEFGPKAGGLMHAQCLGPPARDSSRRRVLGGTVAIDECQVPCARAAAVLGHGLARDGGRRPADCTLSCTCHRSLARHRATAHGKGHTAESAPLNGPDLRKVNSSMYLL